MKRCAYCGKELRRELQLPSMAHRKFCDRACMRKGFTGRRTATSVSWTMGHYYARQLVPEGPCTQCGKERGSDVHHVDGDHTNNEPSNLRRLCRSCHIKAHRSSSHCPQGHEFDDANTYVNPRTGHRTCKRCRSDKMKLAYYRKTGQMERAERFERELRGAA
jgi:hypothetical protein